jgi:hypothetical protein
MLLSGIIAAIIVAALLVLTALSWLSAWVTHDDPDD